jgi:hypothetical protein
MTRVTRAFLLALLNQRAYDLDGRIRTLSRRGGKIPRDRKDLMIAQARKELGVITRATTELKLPAAPVAASAAGDDPAGASEARSVTPAPAVEAADDHELWRLRQQANKAWDMESKPWWDE